MKFFELLQIALGHKTEFSQAPTEGEWHELYTLAVQQALAGVAFLGVERLPGAQRPPKSLLIQWYMTAEHIKDTNAELDRKALTVANMFRADGFRSVVLKGQGIARLYKAKLPTADSQQPIANYRTPGDIDIWLEGSRQEVLAYVRRHVPDCKPVYHHVDFPPVDGAEIEVHFTPSWMYSPFTNRRLQEFFRTNSQWPTTNGQPPMASFSEIPTPNIAFNRVYILLHIYRHLFHEGIGLRQLMDYYFVLCQGFTEQERLEAMRTLRSLRMERFTGAAMWVLQQVFGMEECYMLTSPNEKEGRFLLSEIMLAGNFGKYDKRLQRERGETALKWGLRKVKRNFRFVRSYPSEVLWSPFFKIWHLCWRKIYSSHWR